MLRLLAVAHCATRVDGSQVFGYNKHFFTEVTADVKAKCRSHYRACEADDRCRAELSAATEADVEPALGGDLLMDMTACIGYHGTQHMAAIKAAEQAKAAERRKQIAAAMQNPELDAWWDPITRQEVAEACPAQAAACDADSECDVQLSRMLLLGQGSTSSGFDSMGVRPVPLMLELVKCYKQRAGEKDSKFQRSAKSEQQRFAAVRTVVQDVKCSMCQLMVDDLWDLVVRGFIGDAESRSAAAGATAISQPSPAGARPPFSAHRAARMFLESVCTVPSEGFESYMSLFRVVLGKRERDTGGRGSDEQEQQQWQIKRFDVDGGEEEAVVGNYPPSHPSPRAFQKNA